MQPSPPTTPLAPQEIRVLLMVADGKSYPQIGDELHIKPRTVGQYARSVQIKLGAKNNAQSVYFAVQLGLIHIDDDKEPADHPEQEMPA